MTHRKKLQINQALTQAVREFGAPTTPQQLEDRGVQRLRHVSLSQVSDMIEKAVNRTIMERTIGGMTADLGSLADRAQEGLLGLLKGVEVAEASRGEIERNRGEIMVELAEMRRERASVLSMPAADPNDPTVKKMIAAVKEAFAKLGPKTPESMAVERELAERSCVLLEEMQRRASAFQIRPRDDYVDRLERLASMKDFDAGIASLYNSVQGLSPQATNLALKKELMELIFKANLDLQKGSAVAT
jgi:predicted XRE-type DNA-binding protein